MLLEAANLSVQYVTLGTLNRVVNNLSLNLERGEVVGLVGESGSGKSTAALALLGLTRPKARIVTGTVKLEGRELLGLSEGEWQTVRGAQIGLITQNPRSSLNPVMRVGDQISAIYRTHTGANSQSARRVTLDALRLVGMNDPERRFDAYPHELSGGMAQRIVIAMAVVCRPKVVIADEPTSGLDVTIQAQILDDLSRTVNEVGSALLLVTQDLGVVANYADRIYVMHAGEVVEEATTIGLFTDPAHPTSVALLSSEAQGAEAEFRLQGLPVDGRRLPEGCWLQMRCPFSDADSGCLTQHPLLRELTSRHFVRCHRAELVSTVVRGRRVAS